MKVLVTGSSGLIGSTLVPFLIENGHDVYTLVRGRANLNAKEIAWDSQHGVVNPPLLERFDAIVHLAGENIMGRWTQAKKERIRNSRVHGTTLLCQELGKLKHPPSLFMCASAIGYYGNRGEEILTEQSSKGEGFLSDVCQEWEEAAGLAAKQGIPTISLRIGMVLSKRGGALKQMLPIFKGGLGGQLGNGQQYVSWILIDDLVRIIEFLLHQHKLAGPLNVVSPFPVTNYKFTKTLSHLMHRPTFFGVPAFAVKLVFGQLGEEVLLSSERVLPKKLQEAGFTFAYPKLEEALRHLLT